MPIPKPVPKPVQAAIHHYRLRFHRPFVTSGFTLTHREGLLVRLTIPNPDPVGPAPPYWVGFGDAAPLPGFGGESLADTRQALGLMAEAIEAWAAAGSSGLPNDLDELCQVQHRFRAIAPEAPAARAAIDMALADIAAQRTGLSIARWLHPDAVRSVRVNAIVGAEDPQWAAVAARQAVEDGFETIKVKLAAPTTPASAEAEWDAGAVDARDIARVAAVRAAVGHTVAIRGDANGAWSAERALVVLRRLAEYGVEFVEQPVAAGDVAALAQLRRMSPVRVAADEALLEPGGPEAVVRLGAADVLILKPALLGGISMAWEMARRAIGVGMEVVVTTALESAVGRAAALHLAAAVAALPRGQREAPPERGFGPEVLASGLATGGLLAADVAAGPQPVRGWMTVPTADGLGVAPTVDFEPF